MLPFEFASGSVRGTDHTFSQKNNQDAYYLLEKENHVIGVICDGCGDPTSPHSEVGAQLGVRLVTNSIDLWSKYNFCQRTPQIRTRILNFLSHLAEDGRSITMKAIEQSYQDFIRDHFLFTIVGFVINERQATFFSVGDGTVYVNGENYSPGPFPGNAPPYLAYALLDSSLLTFDSGALDFQILKELPTEELEDFLIGSDGCQEINKRAEARLPGRSESLGNIYQFWERDCYYENKLTLQRRLTVTNTPGHFIDWENRRFNKYHGLLHDDTTLICGRRKVALINE